MATIADAVMGRPLELGSSLDLLVVLLVDGNALVAPPDMRFELAPVFLGLCSTRRAMPAMSLLASSNYVVEVLAKHAWSLWQHNPEFGQQPADAVHTKAIRSSLRPSRRR